jgi:hypothetical protein
MKDTLIEVNKDGVVSYIHKPKTEAKEEKKNENFTQRQIKISSKKEKPLKYDDAAIEKLLDRDQKSTVEDSNSTANISLTIKGNIPKLTFHFSST